jgi:hypothetical protein
LVSAQNPNLRRRGQRAAAKTIGTLTAAYDHAEQRWQAFGEPFARPRHGPRERCPDAATAHTSDAVPTQTRRAP